MIDDPALFEATVHAICACYAAAQDRLVAGIHTVSTDEKTGIQALERAAPTQPMQSHKIERQEYAYIRHDTLSLIASLEVATGTLLAPTLGPTRTEVDFVAHIEALLDSDPDAGWIIICDNHNTHQSATLVEHIAARLQIPPDLGIKGTAGILQSMASRATFLADLTHRIRFVYTPPHCSWLNQIEIWFSILVRRLLKRGNFSSLDALRRRIRAFIDYFNATLAHPFKWTIAIKQSPQQAQK